MMMRLAMLLPVLGACAQEVPADRPPLIRTYHEGEKLIYRMKGVNESVHYEIQAGGVVKQDATGKYFEEYAWSNLVTDGRAFTLPAQSQQFRQILSLDPVKPSSLPNLAAVHPNLIGPITDLLTFYVDFWLAARTGKLNRAGDHAYQKIAATPSWADGSHVIIGEDSIDFDMTLTGVDRSNQVATLQVRHVPPPQPSIHLPAAWMREPVADTQNNWVQVAKENGKYNAAVGKETFDVQIKVSLADGKILSGTMENPVKTRERDCTDAALTNCGPSRPHDILRRIEISLDR